MSLQLASFQFDTEPIYAFVDESGREWYRGTEVCRVLEIANPSVVIQREAYEYSREWKIGVGRPALYVSEPGLYALIFASKSPNAKRFQRWVFEEVLPKLRRGESAIVSTPVQALQIATPNTSQTDRMQFLYRDQKVKEAYSIETVHQVLNYRVQKAWLPRNIQSFYVKLCGLNLIYGHDYWFDEAGKLTVSYVGMEYLLPFARSKQGVKPEVIGMSSCFLVFDHLALLPSLPSSPNGFRPTIVELEPSAMLKAGQINEWYPMNPKGFDLLQSIGYSPDRYKGQGESMFREHFDRQWRYMNALFATLDVMHYVFFPYSGLNVLINKGLLHGGIKRLLDHTHVLVRHEHDNRLCRIQSIDSVPSLR